MMACPWTPLHMGPFGRREASKPQQVVKIARQEAFVTTMYLLAGNSDDTKERQKV